MIIGNDDHNEHNASVRKHLELMRHTTVKTQYHEIHSINSYSIQTWIVLDQENLLLFVEY